MNVNEPMAQAVQAIQQEKTKFQRSFQTEDGKTITINVLKGREGFRIGMNLLKVVLPVVGGTVDGINHDNVLHGSPKTFSGLAVLVIDQMDKLDVEQLVMRLIDGMQVDGQTVDFDEYFATNYAELIEIVSFSLKENFGSLFTEKGILPRLMGTVEKIMGQTQEE